MLYKDSHCDGMVATTYIGKYVFKSQVVNL